MGVLDSIKSDIRKSGNNKGKFIYFRDGEKKRVRFLSDMDDAFEVLMHDSYEKGVNVPCQSIYGKDCSYCNDADLRHRNNYIWSVWDYDSNEVKLLMQAVSRCSPIPALVSMYENYGTLCDRDYVITSSGRMTSKTFSVVPLDKVKFRNQKAKPFTEKQIVSMLAKAFPADDVDEDDDDYTPSKAKSKVKNSTKQDDEWDENDNDYESMTPKQLYNLCVGRNIECEKKKPSRYYINLLEEADKAEDDWGDDDNDDDFDDDEWEDE